MSRAIVFDDYGDADVLHLVAEEPPEPGPGQVRVRVRATAVNRADLFEAEVGVASWLAPA